MATFTWNPLFSWQHQTGRRVTITEFESGKEQRSDRGARPREWTLQFRDRWPVISQIVAFYEARKGPFETFQWTPPGTGGVVNVRFKDEALEVKRQGLDTVAEIQVTLREVL